ncbi:alpha/beta fold hydrolase [Buchnera aphidicola]|uniref:alpha/beta fold hydrolase n=1 Tax=Buchnera aphidicola TaxID=9 RepID=UPI002092C2C8|nr:alpha/beta fold hydrolase [Buchnera aphidicola]USS94099.1 alpha/beta fold hydrolase [Buchnera aphidicola (Sipha maydis)]WII23645.1 alpha/beta fold hydrolase [Buchnera aphidicola (Sipha maydis)]
MIKKFTVILIHGLGFNKKIWFYLKKKLKKHFNVHTINLHIPKKNKNFYLELQNFINNTIISIPKNSILIGWSIGGIIATLLTLKIQEKIKLLVTISSSPCFIKKKSWIGLNLNKIKKLKNELNNNYFQTIKNFLKLQNLNKKNIKILYKKIINSSNNNPQSINFNTKILIKLDTRNLIKKIHIPIFRIYGKFDIIVQKDVKYYVDKILKNENSIIINHANHAPFISHLNLFYKILIKKIRKYIDL